MLKIGLIDAKEADHGLRKLCLGRKRSCIMEETEKVAHIVRGKILKPPTPFSLLFALQEEAGSNLNSRRTQMF